jgi:hypothetical protein
MTTRTTTANSMRAGAVAKSRGSDAVEGMSERVSELERGGPGARGLHGRG